jgi:hypothetical protein
MHLFVCVFALLITSLFNSFGFWLCLHCFVQYLLFATVVCFSLLGQCSSAMIVVILCLSKSTNLAMPTLELLRNRGVGMHSTTSSIHETSILTTSKMKGKNGNQQQAMEGTALDPSWHLPGI